MVAASLLNNGSSSLKLKQGYYQRIPKIFLRACPVEDSGLLKASIPSPNISRALGKGKNPASLVPPPCNTGVLAPNTPISIAETIKNLSLECGLGWLSFTLFSEQAENGEGILSAEDKLAIFREFWEGFTKDIWQNYEDRGFQGYKSSWQSALGIKAGYERLRNDCHISINQSALDTLSSDDQKVLISQIFSLGARVARFDPYLDVINSDINYESVLLIERNKDIRSRASRIKISGSSHQGEGLTLYVGSRTSERFLRLYDKLAESGIAGDESSRWRFELENKGNQAHEAATLFNLVDTDCWYEVTISLLRGFCDFVNRAANTHSERCPLLPWWEQIVNGIQALKLRMPKRERTLAKTMAYLERCVAPSLGFISKALGIDKYRDYIGNLPAPERMAPWQNQFLKSMACLEGEREVSPLVLAG